MAHSSLPQQPHGKHNLPQCANSCWRSCPKVVITGNNNLHSNTSNDTQSILVRNNHVALCLAPEKTGEERTSSLSLSQLRGNEKLDSEFWFLPFPRFSQKPNGIIDSHSTRTIHVHFWLKGITKTTSESTTESKQKLDYRFQKGINFGFKDMRSTSDPLIITSYRQEIKIKSNDNDKVSI